jgi:hypothetical protein
MSNLNTPNNSNPRQGKTQQFFQRLIRWVPLGGSGVLLVSFVLNAQWLQAILAFPVLGVTIGWAAFTEGFLARWQVLAKQWGETSADHLGDRLVNWLKAIPATLKWQLSDFENQYLQCQALACRDFSMEGGSQGSGIFVPLLSEVFVPLELSDLFVRGWQGQRFPLLPGLRRDQAELLQLQERGGLSIWQLLRRIDQVPAYRQMVIKAWGGYGKTTLLRHLTFVYGHQRHKAYKAPELIPFLLYLRDWQTQLTSNPAPDLPTLITEYHLTKLPGNEALEVPPNWAKNLLEKGDGLVMLDGFDEVKQVHRPELSHWIGQQMNTYPKSVFLLTSRPNAYDQDYQGRPPTASLFVKPFNREQQERFLRQWYFCQERYARGGRDTPEVHQVAKDSTQALLTQFDQRPELQDLARNPLLLNLIGTFHRFYPGQELPQRKGELYREICKLQLGARPLAKRVEMPLEWEESQEVLQGLALAMVQKELRLAPEKPLLTLLTRKLQSLHVGVTAEEFLQKIKEVSELLVEREAQEYEFAHLSFQSYLAALEIKRTGQEGLLLQNYAQPFWKETILLFSSQSRNPAPLIRKLCEIGDTTAVDLAYTCWQETTRKLPPEVIAEIEALRPAVQDLRFQALENFLQKGEWKKADQATYRLMITTVGKEEGQEFTRQELLTFPCEELLTIDGLWRRYSQDRYGFSVQKDIYVRCGGRLDGKYPTGGVWEGFASEVGWYVARNWYKDIRWDGTGIPGHLPIGHLPWVGSGMVVWLPLLPLFSHIGLQSVTDKGLEHS